MSKRSCRRPPRRDRGMTKARPGRGRTLLQGTRLASSPASRRRRSWTVAWLAAISLLSASPASQAQSFLHRARKLGEPAAQRSQSSPEKKKARARKGEGKHWRDRFEARKKKILAAPKSSVGVVPDLLSLRANFSGEIATDTWRELLLKVAGDRRRPAVVREVAAYEALFAGLDRRDPRALQRTRELLRAWGYLDDVWVLGPFGDASASSLDQSFAPETAPFSAKQSFRGKIPGEVLRWRSLAETGLSSGAYLSLDDMLYPNTDAIGYVTTFVKISELSKPAPVSLHMGSGGAYRVAVNGKWVAKGGSDRRPHRLQDEHQLQLKPGWNQILVKVSVKEGLWGLYLRLSDRDGAPIPGLMQSRLPQEPAKSSPPDPKNRPQNPALRDVDRRLIAPSPASGKTLRLSAKGQGGVLQRLRQAAKRSRIKDLRHLFFAYRWIHPFDENADDMTELAERIDEARPSVTSAVNWAREERRSGKRGQLLRQAIQRGERLSRSSRRGDEKASLARAYAMMAQRYGENAMDHAREEAWDRAQSIAQDDPRIELLRVFSLSRGGFSRMALARLAAIAKRYPESTLVQNAYAQQLESAGQWEQAVAIYERLATLYGAQGNVIGSWVDNLAHRGQTDAALKLRRSTLDHHPRPKDLAELSHLYESFEQPQPALAAMQKALAISPHHDRYHRQLGEMLLRQGQEAPALKAFARSLKLRPQQPDLRDLLNSMQEGGEGGFYQQFELSLPEIIQKNLARAKKRWPNAPAVVLARRHATRVLDNGLQESLDHRFILVQNEAGIRAEAVQGTVYDPDQSYVEVKRARVYRKNGTIEEIGVPRTRSLVAAGYRMYYDQRQLSVSFAGLQPGDVIEVAFFRRDTARENLFGDYFGQLLPLRGEAAQLEGDYIVQAPKHKKLYFASPAQVATSAKGELLEYRVNLGPQNTLKTEAAMPGWAESLPVVHVSSYQNWNDVANWYWDLVKEQLQVDDAIRDAVAKILKQLGPKATVMDKVSALYEHVVRNTRYVGLEFGIHGYKPYKTTQIYDRRFGDCKDKASLLKVMLAEAGIESYLVLVRTREQGALSEAPASLSGFNHAISYVPSLDLFLDGTAEYSGVSELPIGDRRASVLIVKDGKGGEFRQIPPAKPGQNRQNQSYEVDLKADGSATIQYKMSIQGATAAGVRRVYEAETKRLENLQRGLSGRFPGLKVHRVGVTGADSINEALKIEADLELGQWATLRQQKLRFPMLGYTTQFQRNMASLDKRKNPLRIAAATSQEDRLRIRWPAGFKLKRAPTSKSVQSPFGSLELEVKSEAGAMSLRYRLELRSQDISPKDYGRFRKFLHDIDLALNQRVEVEAG